MLLQRGLDVNARDKGGLSPLLLAVGGRYLTVGTVVGAQARALPGAGPGQSCLRGAFGVSVYEASPRLSPGAPGMGQHCLGSTPCKLQRPEDR